jgi:HNH endonuclease
MGYNKRDMDLARLVEIYGNKCYLCGLEFTEDNPPTRDHVVPRADGGAKHSIKNIRLAHGSCNQDRGRTPADFYKMYRLFLTSYPDAKVVKKITYVYQRDGQNHSKSKYWADLDSQ